MLQPSLFSNQPQGITLSEFNARIAEVINGTPALQSQWVIAETSDLRVVRGHCYMELVEKDQRGTTVAKVSAAIWASSYGRLNDKFKAATGSDLKTGMKVLVMATATYHSQYGFKVVIYDIDPSYTIGDMERQRQEILNRLTVEGLIDKNKQLTWPEVPQRIAIVSAAGAAGYGDFMNQLSNNPYRLQFYTCLFGASSSTAATVWSRNSRSTACPTRKMAGNTSPDITPDVRTARSSTNTATRPAASPSWTKKAMMSRSMC